MEKEFDFLGGMDYAAKTVTGASFECGDIAFLLKQVGMEPLANRLNALYKDLNAVGNLLPELASKKVQQDFQRAEQSSFNLIRTALVVAADASGNPRPRA